MPSTFDRRSFFVRAAAMAVGSASALRDLETPPAPSDVVLRIGVLAGGDAARDRHDGALLGVEEAEQAARLFGGRAELTTIRDSRRLPADLTAVLGSDREAEYERLAGDSSRHGLIMNVGSTSDALRGRSCSARLFHVFPSEAMIRDARRETPGAHEIVVWDGALARFGADTLNGRYEAKFGRPMTPHSWAAWFAVKALWESALRMKSADPARLAEYLVRGTTQFDGHKGRPLSFRPWDRQLRQFLYARVNGKLIDVPENAPKTIDSRTFLDRLGTSAAESACHIA
jgi:hypothetical protein